MNTALSHPPLVERREDWRVSITTNVLTRLFYQTNSEHMRNLNFAVFGTCIAVLRSQAFLRFFQFCCSHSFATPLFSRLELTT